MEMEELHHVGMVVDDIDRALDELGATLSTGWAPLQEVEATLWTPQGVIAPTRRFTLSTSGSPHIELVESVAGTPWSGAARLHHLGVGEYSADSDDTTDGRLIHDQTLPFVDHRRQNRLHREPHAGQHHGYDAIPVLLFEIHCIAHSGNAWHCNR